MNSRMLDLRIILDLEKWTKIQDEIAAVTGLAIITVDYKGVPATAHSRPSNFCTVIRSDAKTAKYCQKCDSRGGLEAARLNQPYIYRCHCNIIDLAVPIIIDGKYIGALMAGQILLCSPEEEEKLEQISLSPINDMLQDDLRLKAYYDELPKLPLERVTNIAKMLRSLTNYIVEEAIDKNLLLEVVSKISQESQDSLREDAAGYPMDILAGIREKMFRASAQNTNAQGAVVPRNPALRPAIDYIANNEDKNISLTQMAKLCHISPGYLSRLIKKETGESFTDYVSRTRIKFSKTLLEQTALSVTEISDRLGFSDSGYFIKCFKKYEGITPALFRNYFRT